ncbi:hypothetical protein H2508_02430 [Parahaliea sp. F7430]|uniref:Lipoprotein n=1 Tax=Sediminihaliea albiluteola TaxID=2758564 RepID=A0A7W2YHZ4_9GAMM|nr:hypothetical protein [Sediminihaliea albiluteola]MBA6411966.1 hypothetical protein [Sediminihaliea albiluteola]
MRLFQGLIKFGCIIGAATLLLACSSTPTYNPTVFQYEIDKPLIEAAKVKTVIIPHVNLGAPSRNYLQKVEPRVDSQVSSYLKSKGYKVLPQRLFKQHWNTAVRAYGDPVDPTTAKVNMKSFVQIMQSVRDQLRETSDLDAFVFTDIVEFEVPFNGGMKHLARWDGVTRRPSLQGPGSGVSAAFDWNQPAAVASLQISIYDIELKRLFASRGGLDATDAIDTRSSKGGYVRRRSVLENDAYIMEGIQLAFHPFIPFKDWPGKAK